jgi:hypothetical protein
MNNTKTLTTCVVHSCLSLLFTLVFILSCVLCIRCCQCLCVFLSVYSSVYFVLCIKKKNTKIKRKNNTEKLTTPETQDTRQNKHKRKQKGQTRMNNTETLITSDTQDTGQINVRENRWSNQEWTILRHWQHWVHNTQDKYTLEKTEGVISNRQSCDTGNIGYTIHRANQR